MIVCASFQRQASSDQQSDGSTRSLERDRLGMGRPIKLLAVNGYSGRHCGKDPPAAYVIR
jgi:hypothetical protein